MNTLALTGAGAVLSGELSQPVIGGADTVICDGGIIAAIGRRQDLTDQLASAETLLDVQGATIAPGLIDSHCHVVLGDYTPRQKTVGFLESYVHGGITRCISPGEIHAPGRPHDAVGVKALAIAARACFDNFRPGGMRVHAGAVVLEPTLAERDFADLEEAGVRLAKFGFGRYADPADGADQVRWAQKHGITVMCHSGGASVPGSKPITLEHLLLLAPDVCGHVNGGPTSLREDAVEALVRDTEMALQIVQAGNLSSTLRVLALASATGNLHRVVIGSDTPTGTGVMPLGVLKTVAEMASLGGVPAATVWALATGNNARIWGIDAGVVRAGSPADLVVMDAPWGSVATDAVAALDRGDIPGISAVVTDGVVRLLSSRNTPLAARQVIAPPSLAHLAAGYH
jgi:enamidase